MRKFSLTLAAAALVLAWAGLGSAVAQNASGDRIEKAANQRLSGSSYISLRGLSYEDCEKRCLAEQQCKALVHVREGAAGAIASQCRLFSTFGTALAARDSDVGYKRQGLAKDTSPPPPPSAQPRVGSAAPPPKPETAMRPAPPPVISAPPPASAPTPRGVTAAPPPPSGGTARSMEVERGPSTRSAAPAPPPPAGNPAVGAGAPPSSDWDVVPVFFGTDRGRARSAPSASPMAPSAGTTLELGRALVTVPKAHQVPNVERPWVDQAPLHERRALPARPRTPSALHDQGDQGAVQGGVPGARARSASRARSFKDQALVFVHGYNTASTTRSSAPRRSPTTSSSMARRSSTAGRRAARRRELLLRSRELAGRPSRTCASSWRWWCSETGRQVRQHHRPQHGQPAAAAGAARSASAATRPSVRDHPDHPRRARRRPRRFREHRQRNRGREPRHDACYAAGNDRALELSRRFWGGVPRAGDVPAAGPLVVAGVDTIDVTAVSTGCLRSITRATPRKPRLLQDIQLLIQTGERPPDKRVPILERVKTDRGDYWRYPK